MKRFLIFFIPLMILVFLGCSSYVTEDNNQNNGRVEGFVHGVVCDYASSEVMGNVEISWMFEGRKHTTRTDASGYYAISELFPGDYLLTFKGLGGSETAYATKVLDINIPNIYDIDIPTDEDFQYSIVHNINMYPLSSPEVKGTVYYANVNGQYKVVKNQKLTLDFSGYNIIPDKYYVTTGIDGKYSITDLPFVLGTIQIYIEDNYSEDNSNYTYSTNTIQEVLLYGSDAINVPDIVMDLNMSNVDFIHNGEIYLPGNDLVIDFAKVINPDDFYIAVIEYGYDQQNEYYESNIPLQSGSWENFRTYRVQPTLDLKSNTDYRLVIRGFYNENNTYFSRVETFTTRVFPN
ncbi:MAG: carboxypeptidase-like regulatory domain-containing protein [Candidatus Cloacimonetes bacterium]|nr:carboxypeptidase-like regulatory domain-containing protein [Candidatus Cloacimonadota bacterium]MDD4155144.1 carboxypeptidase-like regulatory domain-containing protein [Candidatus Cloacimonadota bacterium]